MTSRSFDFSKLTVKQAAMILTAKAAAQAHKAAGFDWHSLTSSPELQNAGIAGLAGGGLGALAGEMNVGPDGKRHPWQGALTGALAGAGLGGGLTALSRYGGAAGDTLKPGKLNSGDDPATVATVQAVEAANARARAAAGNASGGPLDAMLNHPVRVSVIGAGAGSLLKGFANTAPKLQKYRTFARQQALRKAVLPYNEAAVRAVPRHITNLKDLGFEPWEPTPTPDVLNARMATMAKSRTDIAGGRKMVPVGDTLPSPGDPDPWQRIGFAAMPDEVLDAPSRMPEGFISGAAGGGVIAGGLVGLTEIFKRLRQTQAEAANVPQAQWDAIKNNPLYHVP